jgi:hypothetical protein
MVQPLRKLYKMMRMAAPEQFNVDQLAYWNGSGGHTWVARQAHTDITFCRAAWGRAGAGRRVRLWGNYAGACAHRRPRRPRGGA